MIALAFLGAALGAALYALVIQIAPPRVSPLVQLGRLDARTSAPDTLTVHPSRPESGRLARWQTSAGRVLWRELTRRGIAYTTLRQDLNLSGRDLDHAMGGKLLAAALGLPAGLILVPLLRTDFGLALPPDTALLVGLAAAVGCWFVPDLEARRHAAARRREMRHALAIFLDLVSLEMAASAAPAEALPAAARVGAGWPLMLLRDTLATATLAGRDQWTALAELGDRIGVTELRDLGALVRLVAHDGARVRQTLIDRAASMRARELAEAQGKAGQRQQSMQVAQALLGLGFVLFLMYPCVVNIAAI